MTALTPIRPQAPGGPGRGQTSGPSRPVLAVLLVLAVAALATSLAVAARHAAAQPRSVVTGVAGMTGSARGTTRGSMTTGSMVGGSMMGGAVSGMTAGRVWLAGDGVGVSSIAVARARAVLAASPSGLHPAEVIWFSNGFYVGLDDASGAAVTELLVDPGTGTVRSEPGPAMMWNTGSRVATVSPDRARADATAWLDAHRPGETVGSVDAYPGYYTMDTQVGATPAGMLSVNATTGAVWYHTWHGSFVAREDS